MERKVMGDRLLRYAEFCAGIGGFRLGIEKSALDGQLVYVNEIDESCEKTYRSNFGRGFDSKDIFECWYQIYQIVKENCSVEYGGANPHDDLMERLLSARKK